MATMNFSSSEVKVFVAVVPRVVDIESADMLRTVDRGEFKVRDLCVTYD